MEIVIQQTSPQSSVHAFHFPMTSPTAYSNDARGKRVLRGVGTGQTKICQLQDTLSRTKDIFTITKTKRKLQNAVKTDQSLQPCRY
jgi:hypothetical protein